MLLIRPSMIVTTMACACGPLLYIHFSIVVSPTFIQPPVYWLR